MYMHLIYISYFHLMICGPSSVLFAVFIPRHFESL
uniref:Uncharacterized protein n=1 Tax=Anguilla anguilla TaxID=7936 RepID=A0A0E9TBP4_ANGAN